MDTISKAHHAAASTHIAKTTHLRILILVLFWMGLPAYALLPGIDPIIDTERLETHPEALREYILRRASLNPIASKVPDASDFEVIVYIDPSATRNGSGTSPEDPLDSWTRVTTFRSGRAYLQRSGTEEIISTRLANGNLPSGILIGAYGEGPRPRLISTNRTGGDRGTIEIPNDARNIVIRDLYIRAPELAACINLRWSNDIIVYNNELEDSFMGIRGFGSGYRIIGNIIHNTQTNGVYLQDAEDLEIAWNFVFRTNTRWEPPATDENYASGDGVQFVRAQNWHVHNNVIDRSSAGNKFCFISNRDRGIGLLEHNHFIGPRSSGGGASVYLGRGHEESSYPIVIRFNTFSTSQVGALFHHYPDLTVYGNLFINSPGGVYNNGHQTRFYHNVFWNVSGRIMQGGGVLINNIIDNREPSYTPINTSHSASNLFTGVTLRTTDVQGDPRFVDPENGDFRLSPGSDAIDAGRFIESFEMPKDRSGTPIPQGTAPDIGAFEFFVETAGVPDFPNGISAEPRNGEIALAWNTVQGATAYEIWRADSISGGFFLRATVDAAYFVDTGLINDQLYRYRVVAINAAGRSLFSTILSVAPIPPPTHWLGYAIESSGWVNTGDWLGYVRPHPSSWTYIYAFQGWHFLPGEAVDDHFSWHFAPNPAASGD